MKFAGLETKKCIKLDFLVFFLYICLQIPKKLFVFILCLIRIWDYVTSCVIYDFNTHKNDADFQGLCVTCSRNDRFLVCCINTQSSLFFIAVVLEFYWFYPIIFFAIWYWKVFSIITLINLTNIGLYYVMAFIKILRFWLHIHLQN